jgi:hypothetical protein
MSQIIVYLTAVFATFLMDWEVKEPEPEAARQKPVQELQAEVVRMRRLLEGIVARPTWPNA